MPDISRITSILEMVEDLSPSGFAIAFHIRLTSSEFQFQTYPKEWIERYSEKGYVLVDPTVGWGFANTGVIRWSDIDLPDPEGIYEQTKIYGINYGVAAAVETGSSKSVAGFARPDREHSDQEMADLLGYVQELHDLTESKTGMSKEIRDQLHSLSVRMTHPSRS